MSHCQSYQSWEMTEPISNYEETYVWLSLPNNDPALHIYPSALQ